MLPMACSSRRWLNQSSHLLAERLDGARDPDPSRAEPAGDAAWRGGSRGVAGMTATPLVPTRLAATGPAESACGGAGFFRWRPQGRCPLQPGFGAYTS